MFDEGGSPVVRVPNVMAGDSPATVGGKRRDDQQLAARTAETIDRLDRGRGP